MTQNSCELLRKSREERTAKLQNAMSWTLLLVVGESQLPYVTNI
jgi:hypothetical protein